jgi:hypothetical protein
MVVTPSCSCSSTVSTASKSGLLSNIQVSTVRTRRFSAAEAAGRPLQRPIEPPPRLLRDASAALVPTSCA